MSSDREVNKNEEAHETHKIKELKHASFSQPNLEHKRLTQDEIRDNTMMLLTPEQRKHFILRPQLNKKGSLFGIQRDVHRQELPPQPTQNKDEAEEEEGTEIEELLKNRDFNEEFPNPSTTPVHPSYSKRASAQSGVSGLTFKFPPTNASVRGSDWDGRDLWSALPSGADFDGHRSVSQGGMSIVSGRRDFDLGSRMKIEEWMDVDRKGAYYGKHKHFIRIINTLDYDEKILQVSNYETVQDVLDFYRDNYNSNAHNYVWKDIWGNTLKLHMTLAENHLEDQSLIIDELGLDHFPTILLYFKDGFENEPLMKLDLSRNDVDGIKIPCRNY